MSTADTTCRIRSIANRFNLKIGGNYQSEEVGIFGATGLAGVALEEVSRLASNATDETGRFDLGRFGTVALRQVRPVLSFKILSNMPVCFVAISEQLRGINTVYTPWEGQGAHAIASGVRAIQHGDAACALVGGCDTKAHLLGFIALEQQGIFRSWRQTRSGTIPGEGACFLVLEEYLQARQRGARIYARILDHVMGTVTEASGRPSALTAMLKRLNLEPCNGVMAAGDGDMSLARAEQEALAAVAAKPCPRMLFPKKHTGNLFAAAAAIQVGLSAAMIHGTPGRLRVLANCFGYGSQQAAFVLEGVR